MCHRTIHKGLWYLLIGAIFFICGLRAEQSPPRTPRQEPVSILLPKVQDPVLQFAAQELARYLERATGQAVPVGRASAKHYLYVGQIPPGISPAQKQKLRDDLSGLQTDGFLIRTVGPDLLIVGKGSRGTLFGCYAFLERLGFRWFFPGKACEIVPHRNLDWNTRIDFSESPAFRERIIFYWPNNYSSLTDWIDFAAKARLNRVAFHYTWPGRDWYINLRSRLLPECRKRGLEIEVGGHFLSSFLPRTLFKDHPDWFRLNTQGQRVSDYNLNPFSAEALGHLASGAVPYLLAMPEASVFHLWADDIAGGGWSHEPGKEDFTASDQSLLVANDLIRSLRQSLPDARLAFLAYHDTVYPARVVKPEPGVVYLYAPRERCYAHALNDPQCGLNQKYSQALELGLPAFGGENAEVFEYYVDQILFENLANPPLPEVLSADMRYYHQLGIRGVGALMTNTSEFVTPAVNMFLYPQALWNPQRDLNASLKEYAARYFGDASLAAYFQELSRGLKDILEICDYAHPGDAWDWMPAGRESEAATLHHLQGFEGGLGGPLPRALALLEEALRKAPNRLYRARLEAEKVSLGVTLLQARVLYHRQKASWFRQKFQREHNPDMALGVMAEGVLAGYFRGRLANFVVRHGIRGVLNFDAWSESILGLGNEGAELTKEGYSADPLFQHLTNGVSGVIVSGPAGSRAVLWTDAQVVGVPVRSGAPGLTWQDEFGRPLRAGTHDLFASPLVVDAKGISADKLFDALAMSQPSP